MAGRYSGPERPACTLMLRGEMRLSGTELTRTMQRLAGANWARAGLKWRNHDPTPWEVREGGNVVAGGNMTVCIGMDTQDPAEAEKLAKKIHTELSKVKGYDPGRMELRWAWDHGRGTPPPGWKEPAARTVEPERPKDWEAERRTGVRDDARPDYRGGGVGSSRNTGPPTVAVERLAEIRESRRGSRTELTREERNRRAGSPEVRPPIRGGGRAGRDQTPARGQAREHAPGR